MQNNLSVTITLRNWAGVQDLRTGRAEEVTKPSFWSVLVFGFSLVQTKEGDPGLPSGSASELCPTKLPLQPPKHLLGTTDLSQNRKNPEKTAGGDLKTRDGTASGIQSDQDPPHKYLEGIFHQRISLYQYHELYTGVFHNL